MRRDDGEDDVSLFLKSTTLRGLGSRRLRGGRLRSRKKAKRDAYRTFFPTGTLDRKKGIKKSHYLAPFFEQKGPFFFDQKCRFGVLIKQRVRKRGK